VSGTARFGSDELGGPDDGNVADVVVAVRALEEAVDDVSVKTGSGFSDRVMAAIEKEPSPAPGGFLLPLWRHGIIRGFRESVRQAWMSSGRGRPAFARATALAYVLVVVTAGVSLAGAATFGTAGALGIFTPRATAEPSEEPTAWPQSSPLLPEDQDDSSAEPSEAPEATEAPEVSPDASDGPDDHGGGSGPEASDDHGDNSGPGGGDDGAGPGATNQPEASDGHSGSDDGSGSGGSGSGSGSGSGGSGADD